MTVMRWSGTITVNDEKKKKNELGASPIGREFKKKIDPDRNRTCVL